MSHKMVIFNVLCVSTFEANFNLLPYNSEEESLR